jgi:predicted DNA-binding protein (UPF0251 family)
MEEKMKVYYVLMKLQLWPNMEAYTPARQPIQGCGRSAGALLVYDSVEALRLDDQDGDYVMIMQKEGKDEVRHV